LIYYLLRINLELVETLIELPRIIQGPQKSHSNCTVILEEQREKTSESEGEWHREIAKVLLDSANLGRS
jgi:hypothetical protein